MRVAAENRELVPTVMRAFLGDCGLSHAHHAHATRACYLFMRVVKVLRPSLKDYLQELIEGLVPVITAIASNPAQPSTGALKATQGKGRPARSHIDFTVPIRSLADQRGRGVIGDRA